MTDGSTDSEFQPRVRVSDSAAHGGAERIHPRRGPERLLRLGEVEPSWSVWVFDGLLPRSVVMECACDAVAALGYRPDELVVFVRDLQDGMAELRVRGWAADVGVAADLLDALGDLWPEVVG